MTDAYGALVLDGLPDDAWVCCGASDLELVDVPWDPQTMGWALADDQGADAAAPGFFLRNTKTEGCAGLRLPFARMHDGKMQAVREGVLLADAALSTLDIPTLPVSQRGPAQEAAEMIAKYKAVTPAGSRDDGSPNGPDENELFVASMKSDGRVYRMSRVDLHVDAATAEVIDRALAAVDKASARGDSIEDLGQCLRDDGLDEHMTQEGWLMMPVLAARTGSQRYSNGRTSWWEYRSDEEVEASCKYYSLRPFTDDHPADFVTPKNYTRFSKGSCGQDATLLDPAQNGYRHVRVTVLVGDYNTLVKIKGGLEAEQKGESTERHKLELSAGYTCVTVRKPGVDPVTGARYEFRQTEIIINHLALVDRGRAGPLARFSMQIDGVAWEVLDDTRPPAAQEKDDDDVPNDNKDMLEPELGAQLLTAVLSYMYPESPEAKAAAHEVIAEISGVPVEQVATLLTMPEGMEPEEGIAVDIDGISCSMTPDAKAAWDARLERAKESADSVTKAIAGMKGQIDALQATVNAAKAKESANASDALRSEITDKCPALGKAWAKRIGDGSFDLSDTEMREAAVLTMAPELKSTIDAERKNTDTFDATIRGQYTALSGSRTSGPRSDDETSGSETSSNVINLDDLKTAITAGAYGKQA